MVQLVVTDVALSAIQRYCTSFRDDADAEATSRRDRLSNITVGEPIEHTDLLSVSRRLLRICDAEDIPARACRIDALLRGTRVYRAPPQPKPEPVRRMLPFLVDVLTDTTYSHLHTKH